MAVQEQTKQAAAKTVTVACKLPHGLLLRGGVMVEQDEPVMGGGVKTVKRFQETGHRVRINGYAAPYGKSPNCTVSGGFALTTGVDADFWLAWLAQNERHPAVEAGLIFATTGAQDAASEADVRRALRNGLEPIAQKGDPRTPRNVEIAEEQSKRAA